jgi:hypothetical protein
MQVKTTKYHIILSGMSQIGGKGQPIKSIDKSVNELEAQETSGWDVTCTATLENNLKYPKCYLQFS